MRDPWCKRLAILAGAWLLFASALQVVIALTLR